MTMTPIAISQYACPSCGATVQTTDTQLSSLCTFCDTPIVKQNELSAHHFDELMPFRINQQEASQKIMQYIRDSWFVPNTLKKKIRPDELNNMFVPFWVLQAKSSSTYSAEIGINYTETETVTTMKDGKMVTETRTVTKTDWHHLNGSHVVEFPDYIVCASKGLPKHEIYAIEPFDFGQALSFEPALLAGRTSELPVVDVDTSFAEGTAVLQGLVKQQIKAFLTGDSNRLGSIDTKIESNRTDIRAALLPMWVATVNHKGSPLRLLVNGQTGKVGGEIPKDWTKIVFLIFGAILLLVVIYFVGAA